MHINTNLQHWQHCSSSLRIDGEMYAMQRSTMYLPMWSVSGIKIYAPACEVSSLMYKCRVILYRQRLKC